MPDPQWTLAEKAETLRLHHSGATPSKIASVVGKTPGQVAHLLRMHGFVTSARARISEGMAFGLYDTAFKAAMLREIKARTENPLIGVVKNNTPFEGVIRLRPEPALSCCGSPAAECASFGRD